MPWRGYAWRVCGSLLGCTVGCAAVAGAISVSPTRIELSARHPIATLEVRNEGADTITVQLERLAWTQPNGQDAYSADAALIATPTVFELAPHGSQTLRVALRDGASKSTERALSTICLRGSCGAADIRRRPANGSAHRSAGVCRIGRGRIPVGGRDSRATRQTGGAACAIWAAISRGRWSWRYATPRARCSGKPTTLRICWRAVSTFGRSTPRRHSRPASGFDCRSSRKQGWKTSMRG